MDHTPNNAETSDLPLSASEHQVGAVYAKAYLAAAKAGGTVSNTGGTVAKTGGTVDAAVEEFDALVELLRQLPKFSAVLESAIVSADDKQQMLDRSLAGKASVTLLNFLKVVARHGRLDCLRGIRAAMHEQYDAERGRVPVKLTTANPIDAALAKQITDALRPVLGGEPVLTSKVDPALIGGLVLRIGDTVYDGSVAMQLERVREQMINRSVHEIQSRRDRFRNTTGS
ncbi:MAG TPA: ATP synthase F1 subunit delta [Pirellulales bacterium]|jgi:F-type H+-transporting ATPase subunit delta|nr:ATP synthase F1 subunit delta [Pirellulales bacterium]